MAKGSWPAGVPHTAETRAKISRALKGKKMPAATKAKIAAANKKRQALIRRLLAEHKANAAA